MCLTLEPRTDQQKGNRRLTNSEIDLSDLQQNKH